MIFSCLARNRILFYHTGGIGDFITILPAVKALRQVIPGREFILLGRPSIGCLGHQRIYFDTILNADRAVWAGLFSHSPVSFEVRNLFETVEWAFLWTAAEQLPARIRELGVPHVYAQAPFPSSVIHVVDYHLNFISELTNVDRGDAPTLYPTDEDRKNARALVPSGSVMMHPGSGGLAKNWPKDFFLKVGEELSGQGHTVVWIVGPAEEERSPSSDLPGQVLSGIALPVLAAALESCGLFIGNDSGISHLAAAVGAPTIALFGPTDRRIWGPRGASVRVVGGPGSRMNEIAVDEVLLAAREII